MTKPWYQEFVRYIMWIVAGLFALGSILDAWLATIEWIDPTKAIVFTVAVLMLLLSAPILLKVYRPRWIAIDGTPTTVTKLGRKIQLGMAGMLVLVWAAALRNELATMGAINPPPITISVDGRRHRLDVYDAVDLDGDGKEEIVTASSGALHVYRNSNRNEWERILLVEAIEGACDYFGDYAIVNLFEDHSNQVMVWTQCGTGAYLTFEIYRDLGLAPMVRIFNSEMDQIESSDEVNLMESSPQVVNRKLYIAHGGGDLYHYSWNGTALSSERLELDFATNCLTTEFWYEAGSVKVANPEVSLTVGECIYVRYARERGRIPWDHDIRIQYTPDTLEIANALILYAREPGDGRILLWGIEEPLVHVTITSD